MTLGGTEAERLQKMDELLRRCVRCICRILFDEILDVDQSQASIFVLEFSDDCCGVIECLVARSNSPEVFQRGGLARSVVNRMSKATIGCGFENDAVLEPDRMLGSYRSRCLERSNIIPRYDRAFSDGLLFGIPDGCAGLCRLNCATACSHETSDFLRGCNGVSSMPLLHNPAPDQSQLVQIPPAADEPVIPARGNKKARGLSRPRAFQRKL